MNVLESLVIILTVSAVVVFLLHKIRIPSIVGFLLAGVLIGPSALGFVRDPHSVETLAEVGVILLLFTIGIEFSISRLLGMKKIVLGGGSAQMLLTIVLAAGIRYMDIGDWRQALFFGFLISLSSTAIVLKMLAERGEVDAPHGRMMTGILIFQDLCVVPLMLLIPVLSGQGAEVTDIALKLASAALVIVTVLFGARWIVPGILQQVVQTRSRELFITTIVLLCLGIAFITSKVGLSLALGAFLAGLVISESEYAHQAMSDILPFKETFMGIFFVSVGMLMDLNFAITHGSGVAAAVGVIFALKVLTGTAAVLMIGSPARAALHSGLGLAQVGEFSFVLSVAGRAGGLISDETYQIFLSSSVITMMMTPFVMRQGGGIAIWVTSRRVLKRAVRMARRNENEEAGRGEEDPGSKDRKDHVVIIGFGLNGRSLARVLKEAGIPYVALEMNSDTVQEMKQRGEAIHYGDGTSPEILHRLGIAAARLLVVAISDPASSRRIVSLARKENPDIYIVVRTRYVIEVDDLKKLGADIVIPEEFETSVEIFSHVLHRFHYPRALILDMIEQVRSGNYSALRSPSLPSTNLFDRCQWMPMLEFDGIRLDESSQLSGKSLSELQVRQQTGVTVIAVRRAGEVWANPEPSFVVQAGDVILFTGERTAMDRAVEYFGGGTNGNGESPQSNPKDS